MLAVTTTTTTTTATTTTTINCYHYDYCTFTLEVMLLRWQLHDSVVLHVDYDRMFVMIALRSQYEHYIFALWFLLSSFFFFSSPNLSRRTLDVYHTSTHGVALVQI